MGWKEPYNSKEQFRYFYFSKQMNSFPQYIVKLRESSEISCWTDSQFTNQSWLLVAFLILMYCSYQIMCMALFNRYPNIQSYKVNHRWRLRKLRRLTMRVGRARMWRSGGASSASTRRGRASSSTSWTGTGGRSGQWAGQWAGWQGRVQVPGADRQREHHPQHRLQVVIGLKVD